MEREELLSAFHGGFVDYIGAAAEPVGNGFRIVLDLDARHRNPWGIAHGGVLMTLMDTLAGYAAVFHSDPPRPCVSQSCDIHFMRPAREGRLTAEAVMLKAGRHTALVQVTVYDEARTALASGSFEMFYTDCL